MDFTNFDIESLTAYLPSELMVLIPVVFILGMVLKRSTMILDKHIPVVLTFVSVMLCLGYNFEADYSTLKLIYMSVVQGVIVSGISVYVHQMYKQLGKVE